MKIVSLDPRVTRMSLDTEAGQPEPSENMDHWQTYEVFHQENRGEQHKHVGIVHAADADMALLFAKEQYARRGKTANLWVVKTADVTAGSYDDTDIYATTPEKYHREPGQYKVRDRIKRFQQEQKAQQS